MAKVSDVVDLETTDDEPITSLPDTAAGDESHSGIVKDAMDDAALEAAIAEVAETDGEVSIEDLRRVTGDLAKDMSDEDLMKAFKDAQSGDESAEGAAVVEKLPFPIYDAKGVKIEDPSKVTLSDVLTGKVQIGYSAMGKEQRKALTDILRVASNGHYNEHKMTSLMSERQQAYTQLQDLRKEHETWANDRKIWESALSAFVTGKQEPLQNLIKAYQAELGKMPPAGSPEAANPAVDEAQMRAGYDFVLGTIIPHATKLAEEYGAKQDEITRAILHLIEQEPAEFMTREKIDAIMQYEVVTLLENAGYAKGATPAVKPVAQADGNSEMAELKAQVQQLLAAQANAPVTRLRNKGKPPASGKGSVAGAGESMPQFKNRAEMKEYLQSRSS